MAKRSLTVQLDDDVIDRARTVAKKRGTSISQLVALQIEQLADHEERDEAAWKRAREMMSAAKSRGGRIWTRDELYDR